jgi:hypothetical protein
MLTDMIARCCFSVRIDNPTDRDNHFVQIVRQLLAPEEIVAYPTLETWASKNITSQFLLDNWSECKKFAISGF